MTSSLSFMPRIYLIFRFWILLALNLLCVQIWTLTSTCIYPNLWQYLRSNWSLLLLRTTIFCKEFFILFRWIFSTLLLIFHLFKILIRWLWARKVCINQTLLTHLILMHISPRLLQSTTIIVKVAEKRIGLGTRHHHRVSIVVYNIFFLIPLRLQSSRSSDAPTSIITWAALIYQLLLGPIKLISLFYALMAVLGGWWCAYRLSE